MYLILFDFDGTLVDSQHSIVESMETAFRAHKLPKPTRSEIMSVIGLSLEQAVWHLHKNADLSLIHSLVNSYKEAYRKINSRNEYEEQLYEGARELLEALHGYDEVFMGIATGKSRRGLHRVLDHHQLKPFFSTLQTADDARSKPHPEMIERALNETGVDKKNTVMIGDTSFDMEMGRSANVTSIGVSWGYHSVNRLQSSGAHHVVDEFHELLPILENICEKKEAV